MILAICASLSNRSPLTIDTRYRVSMHMHTNEQQFFLPSSIIRTSVLPHRL
jgi:hypothetical protein